MKKVLLVLILTLALAAGAYAQLAVHSRCADSSTTTTQITPQLQIVNAGTAAYSFDRLTARYYYTKEGAADEAASVDYSAVGSENTLLTFGDGYLEIGFTADAGELTANASSGDIQLRINKVDWSVYDQSNDHSFMPENTSYAENPNITLYLDGVLVWGAAPPTPTPTPSPTPSPSPDPDKYITVPPFQRTPEPGMYIAEISSLLLDGGTEVKYSGDLSGRGATTFDIRSSVCPETLEVEPTEVDVIDGYTSGYYLWVWDAAYIYGSNQTVMNKPRESIYLSSYLTEDIEAKRFIFRNYDDPVIMPTLIPLPSTTPAPYKGLYIEVTDAETGELVSSEDLEIKLVCYQTLEEETVFTDPQVYTALPLAAYTRDYLLDITAPGYQRLITIAPEGYYQFETEPDIILLYPENLATPEPVSTPLKTQTPTGVPAPNTSNPQWSQYLQYQPPKVELTNYDGNTQLQLTLSSYHTALRTVDWNEVSGSLPDLSLDVQLIEWDGPSARWDTGFIHTYDLGVLEPGSEFSLDLSLWGYMIKTYSLVVPEIMSGDGFGAADPDPTLSFSTSLVEGMTMLEVKASLFMGLGTERSVPYWPVIVQTGNSFSLDTNVVITEGIESGYRTCVEYASKTYNLGALVDGTYTLNVSNFGIDADSFTFEVDNSVSAPVIPDFPVPELDGNTLAIELDVSALSVAFPETGFQVTVTNYGPEATVGVSDYLIGYCLSVSPETVVLPQGESAEFNVTVDWSAVGVEDTIIYSAFYAQTNSGYIHFYPWEIVLNNSISERYSISGYLYVEQGISIQLSGTVNMVTMPDENGIYTFSNLPAEGEYTITPIYESYAPIVTIESPGEAQILLGDVDVLVNVKTSVCDYAFEPASISIDGLETDLTDQDFMTIATDCCDTIESVTLELSGIGVVAQDTTLGMCNQDYNMTVSTAEYSDGSYTLYATALDSLGRSTTSQIEVVLLNEVVTCLLGDINGDGIITIVDALMVAQYYVGFNVPGFDSSCADVNCDGVFNIIDALMIAQYYVGLISSFSC